MTAVASVGDPAYIAVPRSNRTAISPTRSIMSATLNAIQGPNPTQVWTYVVTSAAVSGRPSYASRSNHENRTSSPLPRSQATELTAFAARKWRRSDDRG
jgi:hypothetical protein